ncbi:MAG: 30S ribosome-binding factor RbfA [Bacteroidetes bacterium]|nr:MAG: 30S ribosome-binding factor RbfA [Bacteroidota bacterium]
MESKRQRQVAEIIRRHFGMLLQQEGAYIYGPEPLVTVTNVKMTPDLGLARIYLSVYNTDNKQAVLLEMEDAYPRLKQALHGRIRKQLRRMPELEFFLDDTLDEMERVNRLLDSLRSSSPASSEEE